MGYTLAARGKSSQPPAAFSDVPSSALRSSSATVPSPRYYHGWESTIFPRGAPSSAKTLRSSDIRTTSSGATRDGISESVSLSIVLFYSAISQSVGKQSSKLSAPEPCLRAQKRLIPSGFHAHYCSRARQLARPRHLDHLLMKMTCRYSITPALTKQRSRRVGGGRDIPLVSEMVERLKFRMFADPQDIWIVNPLFALGAGSSGFLFLFHTRGPLVPNNGARRLGREPFILFVRIVCQLEII